MTDHQAPPHDEQAERRVLCGLLRDFELCVPVCVAAELSAADLYHDWHRRVWAAVYAGYEAHGPADLLAQTYLRLRLSGEAAACYGGSVACWLADTFLDFAPPVPADPAEDAVPLAEWVADAAEKVVQVSLCRHLIHHANELMREGRNPHREPGYYRGRLRALELV